MLQMKKRYLGDLPVKLSLILKKRKKKRRKKPSLIQMVTPTQRHKTMSLGHGPSLVGAKLTPAPSH